MLLLKLFFLLQSLNINLISDFTFNKLGFYYFISKSNNEVIVTDSSFSEIKRIGGYGWGQAEFDEPSDIFATEFYVYVSDKNNSRIQVFDINLNYYSEFNTENVEQDKHKFRFPNYITISNSGEFYIFDSDKNYILKYNNDGTISEIGNKDAGEFSIFLPSDMILSEKGFLYVADGNELKIFDSFGNNFHKFSPDKDNITSVFVTSNKLFCSTDKKVFSFSLGKIEENKFVDKKLFEIPDNLTIKSAKFNENELILLSENKIFKLYIEDF